MSNKTTGIRGKKYLSEKFGFFVPVNPVAYRVITICVHTITQHLTFQVSTLTQGYTAVVGCWAWLGVLRGQTDWLSLEETYCCHLRKINNLHCRSTVGLHQLIQNEHIYWRAMLCTTSSSLRISFDHSFLTEDTVPHVYSRSFKNTF